jgi:DNA polymerase I-like protein with 3'-5' exonuclease and polymerase domains
MLEELYEKYSIRLEEAKQKVNAELSKNEDKIKEYRLKHYDVKLDDPINISSPSQLSILFYQILGYKTKSGKGTGINDLEEIGTDLTKALIEYRKMEKLIDAFLIALKLVGVSISDNRVINMVNQFVIGCVNKIC